MESSYDDNYILDRVPVHNLTTSSVSSVKSPVKRKIFTDCGNSVPESPMRYDNSGHAIRHVDNLIDMDGIKNYEEDDDKYDYANNNNNDNDNDDGIDDDEEDDDDIVYVKLEIVDPYGDKGKYEGGVLQTSTNVANEHPIPSSHGTMEYADGRVYKGQWKNGLWHGRGSTNYPNGDSYEGEYEGDQRHGTGLYKWNDGRVYQGDFLNDQRNGHGVYTWPDGSTYI